jgi:hypothetical protein
MKPLGCYDKTKEQEITDVVIEVLMAESRFPGTSIAKLFFSLVTYRSAE